jgi:imidazoleglycerol phosphate dehydratase HisB/histidinol-phosphate/aromatic aminotransferase/cobyric acid decarboxylase-like protein
VSATLPIREDLADAQPYRWQEGLPEGIPLARFDMNTPPSPPRWYAAAQARLARLAVQSYPDATYSRLRAALAEYTGFPAERIVPTNGADEALVICALAALRPGDRAYARRPCYSFFENAARLAGAELAETSDGARLRFVCSPHNPTGADADSAEVEEGEGLLVIDQAYLEFGGNDHSRLALEREATVVVRTLSKAFALAGARVGYMLVPERLAGPLDAIRLPAGISTTSAALAELALEHVDDMRADAAATVAERDRMAAALRAAGLKVGDSVASFVCVDTGRPAERVAAELAGKGLIVRTFGDPSLATSIRISPAWPGDNDRLLAALGAAPSQAGHTETGRRAVVERRTAETDTRCRLSVDGTGRARVSTGIGFLDHMLTALACHSLVDLELTCQGDLWVDAHHTVEDVAIALGTALDRALGDRAGVRRFGDARAPLDEALAQATVDLSGRGVATCDLRLVGPSVGELPASLVPHYFDTLARNARVGLHLRGSGADDHHLVEAAFKAFALALRQACEPDPRRDGAVPSTKGAL